MIKPAPQIDQRTAADIAQQVQKYLKNYTPGLSESETGISNALIGVFARFAEIIIQRLNKVPEKNLLAFLNLLGASRLPPQPARVPLTFSLTAGSVADAVVPPGTQVAAPPAKGEQNPVIFETERELVVTAAQLASVFVLDPQQDTWSDRTNWLSPNDATVGFVFRGDRLIEHSLYLACDDLFTLAVPKTITLTIQSPQVGELAKLPLIWSYWDSQDWQPLEVTPSTPVEQQWQISIANFPVPSKRSLNGVEASWIKVQLNQALPSGSTPLPSISAINTSVHVQRDNLLPDLAFTNSLPLDLTKDFYPFGENPRLSDTLYIASQEVFSKAAVTVTVNITLNETVPVNTEGGVDLAWEAWDGSIWQRLAVNSGSPDPDKFTQSGLVTFTLPSQMGLREENGKNNYWVRVRIVQGNYGVRTVSNQPFIFSQVKENTENRGRLVVNSVRGFMPGDRILIAPGSYNQEIQVIQSVDTFNNILTLTTALQNTHPVRTGVWLVTNTTLFPPFVKSLRLNYTYNVADKSLSACQKYNNFTYENCLNLVFPPFQPPKESKPTLYFGFTLPQNRSNVLNRRFSLFMRLADLQYGEKLAPIDPAHSRQVGTTGETVKHQLSVTNDTPHSVTWMVMVLGNTWITNAPTSITLDAYETKTLEVGITIPASPNQQSDRAYLRLTSPGDPDVIYSTILETVVGQEQPSTKQVHLSWEYWNGQDWSKFTVEDGTENFSRSGLIQFLLPIDCQTKAEFEQSARYWLRVQVEGDLPHEPRIQWLALNTTWASQSVTILNEILGSSNGSENQTFRTTQFPILANQQLEVKEPEKPSAQEQEQLVGEKDAIAEIAKTTEIWVRWQEVKDFYASSPRDRHYTLNHFTGEITFGNGINGLIPPIGQGNLRMARYQTGGGATGNCQPQTIVQLKTTVPYIARVTNYDAAAGGTEAESIDTLKERLPRSIRHGDRAVTIEDYEDLAMLASPEVARAKCVPLRNLVDDPLGNTIVPGDVSIIIVPRSSDMKPLPSMELLNRVQDYLKNYAIPTANIAVVGPLYVSVSINVDIALTSLEGASAVEQAVNQTLIRFLHPLTGGLDQKGWDFGREPHKSDFYALLAAIPGVDYIRTIDVKETEDLPGTKQTGRFLVYSGKHHISLVFEKP